MPRIYIGDAIDKYWGVSAESVRAQIQAIKNKNEELEVVINSPGGQIFEGLEIYHEIRSYPGPKTTTVAGVAASMGSVIFMAGDNRRMGKGSVLMIHNPAAGKWGESKDLRKTADILDQLKASLVGIYEGKTGKARAEIESMMDATTYFTDEESVTHKFSHAVVDGFTPQNMGFAAVAMGSKEEIEKRVSAVSAKVSGEELTDAKKAILDFINKEAAGESAEGAGRMEITAEMVLEKAPKVAEHFRNEGMKSVTVTADMVPANVSDTIKAEALKTVDLDKVRNEAVTGERKRIAAINAAAVEGCDELKAKAIEEGKSPEAFALEQIQHLKKNSGAQNVLSAFQNGENTGKNVGGDQGSEANQKTPEAEAKATAEALREMGIIR